MRNEIETATAVGDVESFTLIIIAIEQGGIEVPI